jgi:sulfur carrier protein ThiS
LKIIYLEDKTKNLNIKNLSVKKLLDDLEIEPWKEIVKKSNLVLQDNETIHNNDEIKIIKGIHGGYYY